MTPDPSSYPAFAVASIVGSVAFALSGYLAGVRRRLDVMGVFILAFLTANGGGVVRDLLVGRRPAILVGMQPFWLAAATVLAASALRLHRSTELERGRLFVVSDAVGLAAFAITGAWVGIEAGLHVFGVATLAFLTATGGGILRDVLVNEVPLVLHGDFYGSVAIVLGLGVDALARGGWVNPVSLTMLFLAGLALRLVAYRRGWGLPRLK
jgi:uncharacterized membrane protein YeiH